MNTYCVVFVSLSDVNIIDTTLYKNSIKEYMTISLPPMRVGYKRNMTPRRKKKRRKKRRRSLKNVSLTAFRKNITLIFFLFGIQSHLRNASLYLRKPQKHLQKPALLNQTKSEKETNPLNQRNRGNGTEKTKVKTKNTVSREVSISSRSPAS
jgi:hypothetical protein